jgi:enoyl-CoA hydratase/carnithine racemase
VTPFCPFAGSEFRFLAARYGRVNFLSLVCPRRKSCCTRGRAVKAEEAERIGLLNQIVPSEQLRDTAIQMGQLISENAPRMVQGI